MPFPGLSRATFLADLVCPERCAACDTIVAASQLYCARCAGRVRRLEPPECPRCGLPRADVGSCPGCTDPHSPIRAARAWASYRNDADRGPVADTVVRFKYGGAARLGRRMAAVMQPRAAPDAVDLLVPVPLHATRLRERGYNQSAILARHLARHLRVPIALTAVVRTRATPSQVTLAVDVRASNVAGAFRVPQRHLVANRRVLVIDDVWTSGATAHSLAAELRAAGAVAVDVLTFARVL